LSTAKKRAVMTAILATATAMMKVRQQQQEQTSELCIYVISEVATMSNFKKQITKRTNK
jgi:hypothetical protein